MCEGGGFDVVEHSLSPSVCVREGAVQISWGSLMSVSAG